MHSSDLGGSHGQNSYRAGRSSRYRSLFSRIYNLSPQIPHSHPVKVSGGVYSRLSKSPSVEGNIADQLAQKSKGRRKIRSQEWPPRI